MVKRLCLEVLQRTRPRRVRVAKMDRWLWVLFARLWTGWRTALVIVKPETVIAWHRLGLPTVLDVTMAEANPRWGAPRIHGELLKLGIDVCQGTVAKYMGRRRSPPSQTWRTFLRNHAGQIVAADFFVVPTVTFSFVFVLVLLTHDRRRIRHGGGHRASDGSLDRPAGARRVSVGRGAALSAS